MMERARVNFSIRCTVRGLRYASISMSSWTVLRKAGEKTVPRRAG